MSVADNLNRIRKDIPSDSKVTLVAVSKTHPSDKVMEAYQAGQKVFGENKVQELVGKALDCPPDIQWHMIGHLQTNKVKLLIPYVTLIHSVDSVKLLSEINTHAAKAGKLINCLLQVHIAEEETKFGFDAAEINDLFSQDFSESYANVRIQGLMGMATNTEDESRVRSEFRKLKNIFDQLKKDVCPSITILSMGMSGDYKMAIEEGSNMVRIGSAIFGEREYPVG
jgi:pyridoxal phosphate enzyme (YggS family)